MYIHIDAFVQYTMLFNLASLLGIIIIMIHFSNNDIIPNSQFPYTCTHAHAYTTPHSVLFWSDHSSHSVQAPSPRLDPCPPPRWLRAARRSRVLHLRSRCSPPSLWWPDAHRPQPGTLQLHCRPDVWRETSVRCHLPELQVSCSDAFLVSYLCVDLYSRAHYNIMVFSFLPSDLYLDRVGKGRRTKTGHLSVITTY